MSSKQESVLPDHCAWGSQSSRLQKCSSHASSHMRLAECCAVLCGAESARELARARTRARGLAAARARACSWQRRHRRHRRRSGGHRRLGGGCGGGGVSGEGGGGGEAAVRRRRSEAAEAAMVAAGAAATAVAAHSERRSWAPALTGRWPKPEGCLLRTRRPRSLEGREAVVMAEAARAAEEEMVRAAGRHGRWGG